MRISPSDVLLVILSTFTALVAALVIGGLMAHPFSVQVQPAGTGAWPWPYLSS